MRTRTILRNVLSNWTGFFVQVAVVFFLTPFLIDRLGKEQYGVWVLATSVVGYYGLLAFGLHGGVNQYLTRYLAINDFSRMNSVASTACVALSALGVLVIACSFAVAWLSPTLFSVPERLVDKLPWCILLLGITAGIQFSIHVFAAVNVATQRYDVSNAIGIFTRLLSAGLIVLAVEWGYGLVGVVAATVACDVVACLARWRTAYWLLPELSISWSLVSRERFWELFTYSNWAFVGSIATSIFAYTDALVIAWALPLASVTFYALAASLSQYLERMLRPVDQVFFPVVADLHARQDLQALRRVYIRCSRVYLVLVAVVFAFSGVWAKDFYRLWVGDDFVTGPYMNSTPFLFHLLLIAFAGRLFPGLGMQVLLGMLRVKQQSSLALVEAAANLVLSIVLVKVWGLAGVAMGTVISVLLFRTFLIPWLVSHALDVDVKTYCLRAGLRPFLVGAILVCIARSVSLWCHPESYVALATQIAVAGVAGLPVVLFVGMTGEDRMQFFYAPLAAGKKKIARLASRIPLRMPPL